MSQAEVVKILKKEDRWMTSKEIRKLVNDGKSSVNANLCRLAKSGYALKKPGNKRKQEYLWRALK